jgi:beta-1,4-mannosyl-glycoprotein beta-1,4-N-acetylglucosaminyltransferase
MKVIDAFVFYNELEMLNYRLEVLNPHVDYFVLVESTYTHNGVPKILYFNENKSRFSKFLHKIIHVIVDDVPHKTKVSDGRQWENEIFQREQGTPRGLLKVPNIDIENDYVIYSDLDEIINPAVINNLRNGHLTGNCYSLIMDMYYFNLTNMLDTWWACCLMKVHMALKSSYRWKCKYGIPNAGWHLSYFGNAEFIKNKLEHFGHQEYNTEQYTNEQNINDAIKHGRDLFNREDVKITKIELHNNKNLPPRMDLLLNFL